MKLLPVTYTLQRVRLQRFSVSYQLTNKKDLSQPGQFACFEKVTVVGPKGELVCSILGPERPDDQVELSFSDARKIGINPPVKESGDVKGTPGCKLIGPKGEVDIECGVERQAGSKCKDRQRRQRTHIR